MLTKPVTTSMMSCTKSLLKACQTRSLTTGAKTSALIIGAPGSGKGTISNWIVRDFGLIHVSSGDLLRAHLRDGTPLGLEAKSFIAAGNLVPDSVMVGLVASELKKLGSKPWLLDGFPRTQPQAEALQAETPVNVVVNLCVPFETIIDRIKDRWIHPASGRVYNLAFQPPKVAGKDDETGDDLVQREDDKPESVRNRLEVFQASTEPVLEFYRKQGILQDFHGTESKKIWPHVETYLKSLV
eukprot:GFUD01073566.1.p1 GENE.GFUD01073566.1~~GFUD01073566.1.p1  ORF type:complete len:241 (-),score=48.22 GFUD01073566.1:117-839(-)